MVRGPPGLRPRLPPRRPRHGRHPEAEAAFCAAFGGTFPVRLGIVLDDTEGAWAWMDGRPISSSQLKIDVSYCRDEVAKLETPQGVGGVTTREAFKADAMRDCMALGVICKRSRP